MSIRPDITDSLLRREINFINSINDGSKKIGELHVNRSNYRNFEENETNLLKNLFAKYWMHDLISHLRQLDRFVVLTEEDRQAWTELDNVVAIPNPVSFPATEVSDLSRQRVIAVGRYAYQKGFDMLLKAWKIVEQGSQGWTLAVFGSGDREPYERMMEELAIDRSRCHLYGNTSEIQKEYLGSSIFAVSSRFEGLSMAMLEAMSCGLPVVSFACPCGPRDVITDGENGILVPKEDYEQLACGLLRLIQLPDLLRGMGKNAKERAADFKIEMLAGKWVQLFNSL
jgi:glycosyltransferase involved in cell wall biosynthesis